MAIFDGEQTQSQGAGDEQVHSDGVLLGAVLLQGCAGTPATSHADVKLFASDGSARFSLYLACSSHTTSCRDVEQQFQDWATSHQVVMHRIETGDAAFRSGVPSPAADQALPYRLAISYRPDVTDTRPATYANQAGNVDQPWVSYQASITVLDARIGQPLARPVKAHDGAGLAHGWGGIDAYTAGFARDVITRVDPSYAIETVASH